MDIAIVSAGVRLPQAKTLEEFWVHVAAARDLARSVSPSRWPLESAQLMQRDRDHIAHDRVYEVDDEVIDETAEGLILEAGRLAGLDPLFIIALAAAREAWVGVKGRDQLARQRCGIMLGNIALPTAASAARAYQDLRHQMGSAATALEPAAEDPLNNTPAASVALFVQQALGFRGPAFTLDAACASSLYALELASRALERGELDLVLAGGVSRPSSLYTQVGFSALQALSKGGRCLALDQGADGLMVGEGSGIFALKRLADAERDDDRILAVIRGIGLSNDREGRLMAPSTEGQVRAMRAAYAEANWDIDSVDLIECHATGTPIGDKTELESLLELWSGCKRGRHAVLSSVKPTVGHMLTAAGAASLAKVLMALAEKSLPPTAHFEKAPALLDVSPFQVLQTPRPWPEKSDQPRRAAISGFGFGGINAHVLIEEYQPGQTQAHFEQKSQTAAPQRVVAVAMHAILPEEQGAASYQLADDGSAAIDRFQFGFQQFRIPPAELQEALPQQLLGLMLADRLDLRAWPDSLRKETACLIGLELDPMTNLYACRWALEGDRPRGHRDETFAAWQDKLVPPLNANRVIGALGSIVASRIAREARLGGPSFTLSAREKSGMEALAHAWSGIKEGAWEAAVVLALDLPSSFRGRHQAREEGDVRPTADGGVALALMSEAKAQELGLSPLFSLDAGDFSQSQETVSTPSSRYHRGAAEGLVSFYQAIQKASGAAVASSFICHESEEGPRSWKLQWLSPQGRPSSLAPAPAAGHTILRSDLSIDPWLEATPYGKGHIHRNSPRASETVRVTPTETPVGTHSSTAFPSVEGQHLLTIPPADKDQPLLDQRVAKETSALGGFDRERLARQLIAQETSHIASHQQFLRCRVDNDDLVQSLLQHYLSDEERPKSESSLLPDGSQSARAAAPAAWRAPLSSEKALYDYGACEEFARGLIGKVFGSAFAAIDQHPTRVRLPDERLLLCHRVMSLEGEAKSLGKGRMVTEHDVFPESWYLENGRMPTAIAVESGQADLMLASFLGADFRTEGRAVYRLLDAQVTFHRGLPRAGEVIRYHIEIKRFFEQGGTLFFQFAFEASIAGEALMSMRDGCAGFFDSAALEAGRGIKRSQLQLAPKKGRVQGEFKPFVPMTALSLSDQELDALRIGAYAEAFGPEFAGLSELLSEPMGLPGGDMRLVHRVISLEPEGGRFGLGRIIGEADIHPGDWFLTCHFVDDQVMPGTLMYECCLHTLRVFLMRLGWVGESSELCFEPVPGVWSQLKCRGQVLADTQKVRYDIEIKEIGYGPEPYVLCDALMSADGKDIVDITDMSLRLSGLSQTYFEELWNKRKVTEGEAAARAPEAARPPQFTYEQILAFSSGRPSDCFGPIYKVFDEERKIARLPRPPFQFLDRIERVEGPLMTQNVGTHLRAAYDAPDSAWYWEAEGNGTMPLAVLVEIALQPCGFMAAYMGSALLSPRDLAFRNLSGDARLHQIVRRGEGTLWIDVACTKISRTGDMIIQDYSFAVHNAQGLVYQGQTSFGFFSQEALQQQVGLRGHPAWTPPDLAIDRTYPEASALPRVPLVMVDHIDQTFAPAGRYEAGILYGRKRVRADEWFFEAHFYQDPVMPGSLGLQALEQVLKAEAHRIWPNVRVWAMDGTVPHRWTYRGQVVPRADELQYEVHVKNIDHERQSITADAWLYADGRPIYSFEDLTLCQAGEANGR